MEVPAHKRKQEFTLPPLLRSIQAPNGWAAPTLVRPDVFTQSTDSEMSPPERSSQTPPRK